MRANAMIVAALLLSACGRGQPPSDRDNRVLIPDETTTPPKPPPPRPRPEQSLAEPRGPIDSKSVEAAGQVVQHYGALVEQQRWAEAARLWGDRAAAEAFALQLRGHPDVHVEIGNLGAPEGGAGSIYVTMPVAFYGNDPSGRAYRRSAEIVLRRVNDVPGSTEAQRRWHIERIDWKAAT
jgi:hypothetical protein